jgi:adenylate cyclase
MRRAFGRYVSPGVIDNLVAHPEQLVLGGEKREMSFVFSDIAAFTTLSEGLPPQELVSLLQDYFDGMAKIAMKFDGTIERFLGDSVLVFFGAPAHQSDHVQRAVNCALEWDTYCEKFRRDQLQHNPDFGVTRIGVHSGNAVVGNVGSRDRFEYTAHGDTVNTAARLESANKHFGTRVCISGPAAGQCSGVTLRPVGDVIFKGKEEPLAVLSTCQDLSADAIKDYLAAFESLRQNEPDCIDSFSVLADRYPEDGLIAFYLERLKRGDRGTTIRMEQK